MEWGRACVYIYMCICVGGGVGGGLLWSVCCKVTMQSGGRGESVCICVKGVIMGCLPPDLFVCMQGVLVGEGETATSYGSLHRRKSYSFIIHTEGSA